MFVSCVLAFIAGIYVEAFYGLPLKPVVLGLHDPGKGLRGVVIAIECSHRDRSRKPCGSTGEIVELIAEDPADPAIEPLVIRAMMELNERRVDTVDAATLHPSLHPILNRLGFVAHEAEVFQMAMAANDAGLSGIGEDWYYTAGDSDALYSPGL